MVGQRWEHSRLMPVMTVSRVMQGEDPKKVFASVKNKLLKRAQELPTDYPNYKIKLAKEAGFELSPDGLVTGNWFFSLE